MKEILAKLVEGKDLTKEEAMKAHRGNDCKSNISGMRSRCHCSSSFHNGLYVCKGHPGTGKGRGD